MSALKEYYEFCDLEYQEIINIFQHDGYAQKNVLTRRLISFSV